LISKLNHQKREAKIAKKQAFAQKNLTPQMSGISTAVLSRAVVQKKRGMDARGQTFIKANSRHEHGSHIAPP